MLPHADVATSDPGSRGTRTNHCREKTELTLTPVGDGGGENRSNNYCSMRPVGQFFGNVQFKRVVDTTSRDCGGAYAGHAVTGDTEEYLHKDPALRLPQTAQPITSLSYESVASVLETLRLSLARW